MLIKRIEGSTRQLGAPADWDGKDMSCGVLPILDVQTTEGNFMFSAWEPTPPELEALSKGANILLGVRGTAHPVVSLQVAADADVKHPDDVAVDQFAEAMKAKLADARAKGRSGWQDCDPAELSYMLRDHVEKGDPRDVANFCMFLWSLGKPIGDTVLPISGHAVPTPHQETFQSRVKPWMMTCFGEAISNDLQERNHRFLEEALELVQSTGCTQSEAHQLVDYVFGRPVGEPAQEVGGVMVTLAALCLAAKMDMHAAGETELARIWTKVEQIRAKQAAKPKHSPLPIAQPSPAVAQPVAYTLETAPIGSFAPSSLGGGWTRNERGWESSAGVTFPRPGGDWTGEIRVQPVADERAAFEHAERSSDLKRDPDEPDMYFNESVQAVWEGWQKRAALCQPAEAAKPVAFREVAADGTPITDWIDGALPPNTPPLHPGATIQFAYGAPAAEPIAWEATTPAYAKYITDARYQKLHPGFKPWFKPYRCSQCSAAAAATDKNGGA